MDFSHFGDFFYVSPNKDKYKCYILLDLVKAKKNFQSEKNLV